MNINEIKVLGIVGSLRENSYNKALIRAAIKLHPDNMQIVMCSISDIPLYNDDELADVPQAVNDFKQKISDADALLIVTPEYNYSIPGVLKNAIDWASRPVKDSPLNGKPLAIIGATSGRMGTVRAQMHLRQIAVYTNMLTLNKPEVLIANAREKFDKDGNLTDESTKEHVRKLLDAFAGWIIQLNK